MADMNLTPLAPLQPSQGVQQAPGVSQGSSSQTPQIPTQPAGTVLNGFIVNRDANGNPILRTENGDFPFATNFFLKIGAEVVVRFENRAGATQAHVLSVNGQPPELAEQQSSFDEQPEVIVSDAQEPETSGTEASNVNIAPMSAQPNTLNAVLLQAMPAGNTATESAQTVPLTVRIIAVNPQPAAAAPVQSAPVQGTTQAAAAYARTASATPAQQLPSPATAASVPQAGAVAEPVQAENAAAQPSAPVQPQNTPAVPQTPIATQASQAPVQNIVVSTPAVPPEIPATQNIIAIPAPATATANAAFTSTMLVANEVTAPAPQPAVATATATPALPAVALPATQLAAQTPVTPAAQSPAPAPQAAPTAQTVIMQPADAQEITVQTNAASVQTPAPAQTVTTPAQAPAIVTTQPAQNPTTAPASQTASTQAFTPGQTVTATVISNDANGAVVQTPVGLMRLPANTGLQPGSSVTLQVTQPTPDMAATPATPPSTPAPLTTLARQWGTLQQLVTLLSEHAVNNDPPGTNAAASVNLPSLIAAGAPAVAQAAVSPQAISTGLMFFLTALRGNDFRNWLGASNADWLLDQGHDDLLKRAEAEFSTISQQYSTAPDGQWRALFFPIAVEGEFQQVRMFTKRDRKGQGSGQKQQAAEDTRFIVEVTMSQLGELQMDGFVRRQDKAVQFDLFIRSLTPLNAAAQKDILQIYNNIGQLTGYKGNLLFQAVKELPVNPMEEVVAHAMRTVVA